MHENNEGAPHGADEWNWDTTGLTPEQDVGVALSSIRNYAREHGLSGREVMDVFNVGLVRRHQSGRAA